MLNIFNTKCWACTQSVAIIRYLHWAPPCILPHKSRILSGNYLAYCAFPLCARRYCQDYAHTIARFLSLFHSLTLSASLSRCFGCHSKCNISLCFWHFVVCRRLCCLANSIMQCLRVWVCMGECVWVHVRACVSASVNAIEVWHPLHTFTCLYLRALLDAFNLQRPSPAPVPLPCCAHIIYISESVIIILKCINIMAFIYAGDNRQTGWGT